MGDRKKKYGQMGAARFWFVIWGMGLAGQICWNIENQWFNTFVYAKISGDVNIVTSMVMVSALVTTISTLFFGTLSDRRGKRKRLISPGQGQRYRRAGGIVGISSGAHGRGDELFRIHGK